MSLNRILLDLNVSVHKSDLLKSVKGISYKSNDGYIIEINSNVCDTTAFETLVHELLHIGLGHLDEHRELPEILKELEVNLNMERLREKYAEKYNN